MAARRVQRSARVEVSSDRGVFMISVAAELADMHPQTLRMYEARGLIEPKRSPKGTRLYSHKDVERLRRIQEMTAELGMNLAGVERVFELELQLEAMERKVRALEKRAGELKAEVERLEMVRRELRAEIVPYTRGGPIIRNADLKQLRIRVQRASGGRGERPPDARAQHSSESGTPLSPEPGAPRSSGPGTPRSSGPGTPLSPEPGAPRSSGPGMHSSEPGTQRLSDAETQPPTA
jgi:MerR family transcriptional regulator, heat shock protein HspR